jgi:hypothetical protein
MSLMDPCSTCPHGPCGFSSFSSTDPDVYIRRGLRMAVDAIDEELKKYATWKDPERLNGLEIARSAVIETSRQLNIKPKKE